MSKFKLLIAAIIFLLSNFLIYGFLFSSKPHKSFVSYKLFFNGNIYIDADTKVNNLLVGNEEVISYNVIPEMYKEAEIVDLKGATAYPGFNDSHVHLMESGYFYKAGMNLSGVSNVDEIVKKISERVKSVPEGGLILGFGFSLRDYDKWTTADLEKIDKASGNRILFLGDKLGHNAIINTATISFAGITPDTKVPLGGKMILHKNKVTGMLRESAMILPWNKIFKLTDKEDIKEGAIIMLKKWASMGYTGIVDLMGATGLRFMTPEVFLELEKEGKLPLRVNYTYTIFNLNDVDDAIKYKQIETDMVRFIGCKIFVDGAFAGGQAWTTWKNAQGEYGLNEIYTDDRGGPELNLNRIVSKVEEYGMNMHYHAQGDMALIAVLNALDKVIAEKGEIKSIHTLVHAAFPNDEIIERIKKYNGKVVVTTQPGFWPVENDTKYYYGEMNDNAYPIKKLINSGIMVGLSTDFSVSPPEYTPPAVVLKVAVTGDDKPEIHTPLTVRDVINGFSFCSAITTGRKDTGKLEAGFKADIVIFEKDFYELSAEEISIDNPKVIATYVNGNLMYSNR